MPALTDYRLPITAYWLVSGQRLTAAVDARIGRKYTGKFDKFTNRHAAQDAFDYWAERLQTRLREERDKGAAGR